MTARIDRMFFYERQKQDVLGSRCPLSEGAPRLRPASAREPRRKGEDDRPLMFKPRIKVNTYLLHKRLFDIAKDEMVTSAVLEYFCSN